MYRLLIVEDEEIIRKALPIIFDWESIGIKVAGTAANGVEALKFLERESVDIVLTDIRMPVMNGLELACEIKSKYPRMKTILLSAYDEFEYARKGIEYGVYGYLLKSSDEDEIKKYFIKLKENLDKELMLDSVGYAASDGSNFWMKREEFIKSILKGDVSKNKDEIIREGRKYKMRLAASGYNVILVQIDELEILADVVGEQGIRHIRKMLAEQLLDNVEWQNYGFVSNLDDIMCIIWTSSVSDFRGCLDKLFSDIGDELSLYDIERKIDMTWSVGSQQHDILSLPESYADAKRALQYKIYLGGGRIIYSQDFSRDKCNELTLEKIDEFAGQVIFLLDNHQIQRVLGLLDEIEEYLVSNKVRNKEKINVLLMKIMVALSDMAGKVNLYSRHLVEKAGYLMRTISRYETIYAAFEQLKVFAAELAEAAGEKYPSHAMRIVDKAMDYILNNYKENITLEDVAKYVNVHPVHLSRLFKQELDKNFKHIITEIRVAKAKELLKNPSLKVYEIAQAVGYRKPRYFSDLFKEFTGITPLEYRGKQ